MSKQALKILLIIVGSNVYAAQDGAQNILDKGSALENQIESRRLQATSHLDSQSQQYKLGFTDGYNMAVIDLVKTGLMPETSQPTQMLPSPVDAQSIDTESVKSVNSWLDQSFDHLMDGDWSKAVISATQALTFNSQIEAPYINRSWGYAEKGLTKQAIEDAEAALELNPHSALAYNNRGYAYEIAGQTDNAKKDYRLACQLRYQAACQTIRRFENVVSQQNRQQIQQLTEQTFNKFQQKDWQAVEEIATQILKLDPANAIAYVNRSGARSELGRLKSALDDSIYAIELNPNLGAAYNNKGHIYELLGEVRKASREYKTACQLGVQQSCSEFDRLGVSSLSQ